MRKRFANPSSDNCTVEESVHMKFSIVPIFRPLILISFAATTAWSQQHQAKPEDSFLVQHRQAVQKNPEGVSFTLRIKKDKPQFKPGEMIPVEYSFTSSLPKTYDLDGATYDRVGRLHLDKFFLDQKTGVTDPLGDYLHPGSGMGGIRSDPTLGTKPHIMMFVLNEWFRFDQPGKFRLYVTAPRIRKIGKTGFRDGAEVTSNIVEFEIMQHDPDWAEQELEEIKHGFASPEGNQQRAEACLRLRFLNTEAAASEMVRRYGAPWADCEHQYSFGLIGSPHRAFAVKEMERRLEAADQIVSDGYLWTLSHLAASLRQKTPLPVENPKDAKQAEAIGKSWQKFDETRQLLKIEYAERLASALSGKEKAARAIGLHTLLEIVWNQNPSDTHKQLVALVEKLAPEIIAVFDDLPLNIQTGLLEYRWKQIAGPSILPTLRKI